jgi:nitroreductase
VTNFDLDQIDELLLTTKQVRFRLDLTRNVPIETVLECIQLAGGAPQGGNTQRNRWLLVDDPDKKSAIAEVYARVGRPYLQRNIEVAARQGMDPRQQRVIDSSLFLVEHMAEVPLMVIPIRLDRPVEPAAGYYGSNLPGVWSFQVALRARGLGSTWTTFHLEHEQEIAELLGIPDTVTQTALLPVAYYTGDSFSPAPRRPAEEITYLNAWRSPVRAGNE